MKDPSAFKTNVPKSGLVPIVAVSNAVSPASASVSFDSTLVEAAVVVVAVPPSIKAIVSVHLLEHY